MNDIKTCLSKKLFYPVSIFIVYTFTHLKIKVQQKLNLLKLKENQTSKVNISRTRLDAARGSGHPDRIWSMLWSMRDCVTPAKAVSVRYWREWSISKYPSGMHAFIVNCSCDPRHAKCDQDKLQIWNNYTWWKVYILETTETNQIQNTSSIQILCP